MRAEVSLVISIISLVVTAINVVNQNFFVPPKRRRDEHLNKLISHLDAIYDTCVKLVHSKGTVAEAEILRMDFHISCSRLMRELTTFNNTNKPVHCSSSFIREIYKLGEDRLTLSRVEELDINKKIDTVRKLFV